MNRTTSALLAASAFAAAWLLPTRAHADSHFAPIRCSTAGQLQTYQWKVGVDAGSDIPLDPVAGTLGYRRYDNQQKHARYLLTNAFVTSLSLRFASFETETSYDTLTFGGTSLHPTMTGALGATTTTLPSLMGSFQAVPLIMNFQSDSSVTKRGFDLASLTATCSGTSNDTITTFSAGQGRVDGVLLGYNDVVYTSFASDPGAHSTLSMWSPSVGSGQDFDVYLACGRRPSPTDYDLVSNAGTGSGNSEFVHIDPRVHPCASTWQVAVLSYGNGGATGQGYFHLLWSKHRAEQDVRYTVGIQSASSAADVAQSNAFLTASAKTIYGATNGQVLLTYDLDGVASPKQSDCYDASWSCAGAHCNVCLRGPGTGGGGSAYPGANLIDIPWDTWHGGTLAHEFGHAHLGLQDDYVGVQDRNVGLPGDWPGRRCLQASDCAGFGDSCSGVDLFTGTAGYCALGSLVDVCGHSMMANGYISDAYCTAYDHLHDARYVQAGWETQVLTLAGNPNVGYSSPISYAPFAQSTSPWPHSTRWTDRSDYQVALDNGVFLFQPGGSPDPYRFADFNAPGFQSLVGAVTYHP